MIIQYKNPKFRFTKIQKRSKAPFEKNWNKKGYTYDEIQKWISDGNNYGVLCGPGDLCVLDVDDSKLLRYARKLPKTFEVITGSGGLHLYYICPELKKKIILLDGKKHLGEIQSHGTQIIAAGSIHPNGNKYHIYRDLPIQKIRLEKLKEVLNRFIPKEKKKERKVVPGSGITAKINEKISILDIAKSYGFEIKGNKARCLFHKDSIPSLCFDDGRNFWFCHGCRRGGNLIDFVAECKERGLKKK